MVTFEEIIKAFDTTLNACAEEFDFLIDDYKRSIGNTSNDVLRYALDYPEVGSKKRIVESALELVYEHIYEPCIYWVLFQKTATKRVKEPAFAKMVKDLSCHMRSVLYMEYGLLFS